MTAAHHQPSAHARVGFVFICPGRFERSRLSVCGGYRRQSGANSGGAESTPAGSLPSAPREEYVITNSWAQVEFPALTGRSVPSVDEVLQPANLRRLGGELAALDNVIACGAQAHAAVRALCACGAIQARPAFERHLSQRSVNMIRLGVDTPSRLRLWCDVVLARVHPAYWPVLAQLVPAEVR